MDKISELACDYKVEVASFVSAAQSLSVDENKTVTKLHDMFMTAVRQKSTIMKRQGVEASLTDVARAVANDINAKNPEQPKISNSYGVPSWFAGDTMQLFNWISNAKNDSTIAKGVEVAMHMIAIEAAPQATAHNDDIAPTSRYVA